jgi:2-desacetyl-2-hydroxyethyl bacteriochlorophyllide A dehydrogenase
MPRKAPAILFPEINKAAVEEVPIPEPGDRDVLVQVEYSAISPGTERWCLTGRLEIPGEPPLAFPHVPGYQAAGIVLETGHSVTSLKSGDRVFSRNCRAPADWKGSWWGGHVGLHVAEEAAVIRLPDSVSLQEASGLLLAQVGYNGATKPPVSAGATAAVIGDGLVGQYASQVLRHRGARVLLSGLVPRRLKLAARHSADEVFDASRGDFTAFARERFPKGVAVAVETASSRRTVCQAIDLLAYGGHLVLNGFYPPSESLLDWHWLRAKELTAHFPNSRTRERLEGTLRLIGEGAVRVQELTTHTMPLDEAPKLYEKLLGLDDDYLGLVIQWRT